MSSSTSMILTLLFFYVWGLDTSYVVLKLFSSFLLVVVGLGFLFKFMQEQRHDDGTPFEEFTTVLGCAFFGGIVFAGILLFIPVELYYKFGYVAWMFVLFGLLYGALKYEYESRIFVWSDISTSQIGNHFS